jgi:hypothetical protein
MPEIKVRGFRGAERGDILIEPIALLAGSNFQGKSSMCQAAAAVVTGQAIPFFRSTKPDKPMLTKSAAKQLVRGGMDKGSVTLADGEEVLAQVNWPSMQVTGNGEAQCSKIAAGLVNPLEMEDDDRQAFFSALLQSEPTDVDIEEAFKDAKIPDGTASEVRKSLAVNGWDVSHKGFKEDGAHLKGQWEAHAGTKFGASKAASWRPEGWRDNLEGVSLEQIGSQVSEAQRKVEAAIAALAVGDEQLQQLKVKAEAEEHAAVAKEKASSKLAALQEDYNRAKAALSKIVVPQALACPHCGGAVQLEGQKLVESMASAKQIAEAQEKYDVARSQMDDAKAAVEAADKAFTAAKAAWEAVRGSKDALLQADHRKGNQDAVDVARDFAAGMQKDKERISAVLACTKLAEQIAANQKVVDILAPEGLRRQKLAKALASFNKSVLAPLCAAADFPAVTVDEELDVLYGGRPYFLLSESEKYRVRSVLQLSIARKDGSPISIFDGADILDQTGRNGLFNMLASIDDMGFIVAMTVEKPDDVPNLADAGIGHTYWVQDGVARQVANG